MFCLRLLFAKFLLSILVVSSSDMLALLCGMEREVFHKVIVPIVYQLMTTLSHGLLVDAMKIQKHLIIHILFGIRYSRIIWRKVLSNGPGPDIAILIYFASWCAGVSIILYLIILSVKRHKKEESSARAKVVNLLITRDRRSETTHFGNTQS